MKDLVVHHPYVDRVLSTKDQKSANYFSYHQRKENPLRQSMVFRRLFDEKLKGEEIFALRRLSRQYPRMAFPKASGIGKRPCPDGLPYESRCRADSTQARKKFKRNGSRVQNLLRSKNFYNQMDFRTEQQLAPTKAIIELTDPS